MAPKTEEKEKSIPMIHPKTSNKTLFVSHKNISEHKKWILIDANGMNLGKLAVYIADLLRGKSKPYYTPHVDCGDNVIIVNAHKIAVTGNKEITKRYYKHTGFVGNMKIRNVKQVRAGKNPHLILEHAVKGMVGSGKMARARMRNLYLYSEEEHPHQGQQPTVVDFASLHKKNRRNS